MLKHCSCSLTGSSMSTLERPGEGWTSRPAGCLGVSHWSWAGKPKISPPSLIVSSISCCVVPRQCHLAHWAYRVSLKPHHQTWKASSTVKGGTAGTCQPLVGLGHASLPVGCSVGTGNQHIPFLHKVLLTAQLHSLCSTPSPPASQVLIFYF